MPPAKLEAIFARLAWVTSRSMKNRPLLCKHLNTADKGLIAKYFDSDMMTRFFADIPLSPCQKTKKPL